MKTYTYSEARQRLATILDEARRHGCVQIRRRDGQLFVVEPATPQRSPLDVPGVRVPLRRGETLEWLHEGREQRGTNLLREGRAGHRPSSKRRRTGSRS